MINHGRLEERIQSLGMIGATPEGGVARLSLSKEDREAQMLVSAWMQKAGMEVRVDPAGNLIGRIEGTRREAQPVVIGSHIDSVVNGGKYDGVIGVIGGIEVVQHLHEEGIKPLRPIEVIAFCEEEGSRFQSGLFGSRAMVGAINEQDFELVDQQGMTRREALIQFGLDPKKIKEEVVRRQGAIQAYLEMHIEQGPVLELLQAPIGIVNGIAGPAWVEVTVQGKAGHAGTLPMNMRQDALLGAAQIALLVEDICHAYQDAPVVGTVGHMEVLPGGANTVPGRVVFSVDVRDIDKGRRDEVMRQVKTGAQQICEQRGLGFSWNERLNLDPVECSPSIIDVMKEQSLKMKLQCPLLISGAGHDAQLMAVITEMGMIFVRCKDGVSHNPAEYADIADIALGTELLSRVALHLASQ
ncbi:M20 family metallo-hydrolase [Paenibacillus xerothermodurans]|uniref:Zn-dependent hydrolase n=1 Tax=Paenibacillus xerothermodurans TaxID=1977292 RepID=A0A2W1NLK5_PAEXE|nr:M20 family metallo-hydrolase [Paenibacillus xerothermodurans]PZE20315.1 Zn-dependent hydrolase [Paenibacillus xerothermodurans]